jgi:hypothetical protein
MSVTQITPQSEIEAYLKQQVERRNQAILYKLASIAEQVANFAKETRGYTDRTGNLVSSTGYVLVQDAKVISGKFESALKGESGAKQGEAFAAEIAATLPQGIGFVIVAGMNYAAYVEAKGFNVLAISEIKAQKLVEEMIAKLGLKAQ